MTRQLGTSPRAHHGEGRHDLSPGKIISIIDCIPGAVLFIPVTDLFYNRTFAPFLCHGICFTLNKGAYYRPLPMRQELCQGPKCSTVFRPQNHAQRRKRILSPFYRRRDRGLERSSKRSQGYTSHHTTLFNISFTGLIDPIREEDDPD